MEFLFSSPTGMPLGTAGGIFPALMGTLGLGMICGLVASLLGVATAIYLRLYCQSARIESGFRIVIQCIAGIPSIVLGLFGYTFFVVSLQMGMSLMAGGLTLAIMIFPVVAVTTEKAIAEAEREQVLASYSLGASRAYTFFNLILPQCKSDILSGIILATAYAMGATAPIMLTASVLHAGVPSSLFNPVMALPYHLYILASEHLSLEYAYGTALVLVGLLLFIHGIAFALFLRTRSET
ncbi:phosphate transport system permease protein [Desulfitispora alkaliphila]|uniref:PstA family ABC transporter permease n=1 Tax=Desulfitispora alkaliphila TaxID=622674 RepID=UPI003D247C51